MKRIAVVVTCVFAFSVPSSSAHESKHIRETVDPFTGRRTLSLDVDTHACPDDPPVGIHETAVHLIVGAAEVAPHGVQFSITADLSAGPDTLRLRENGSMDTLIDATVGQLITPFGSTITREVDHVTGRRYTREMIPFPISLDELHTLSEAHFFEFRINGAKKALQRCADPRRLHEMTEFLSAAADYK